MRYFLLLVFTVIFVVDCWKWEYYDLNSAECNECDSNFMCSRDIGVINRDFYVNKTHVRLGELLIPKDVCVIFRSKNNVVTKSQFLERVSDTSVITFIGDSNARNLFESFLRFLDEDEWIENVKRVASTTSVNRKYTVDHVMLCHEIKIGNKKLFAAYLWKPFLSMPSFYTSRSWSNCDSKCRYSNVSGVRHCDSSDVVGADIRWDCSSHLDSVQTYDMNRDFITVSHAGIHDALHKHFESFYNSTYDETVSDRYSALSNLYINATWKNTFEMNVSCWSHTKHSMNSTGGYEIFVSPLHVRRGTCCLGADIFKHGKINEILSIISKLESSFLLNQGLIHKYINAFSLTDDYNAAPFPLSDGIHFPKIMYNSILGQIIHYYMKAKPEHG